MSEADFSLESMEEGIDALLPSIHPASTLRGALWIWRSEDAVL
jgi:hypothetical protein